MTRQESIIKTYQERHPAEPLENPVLLLEYEYSNYAESCEHCGEQPLDFEAWINEPIKPKLNPITQTKIIGLRN